MNNRHSLKDIVQSLSVMSGGRVSLRKLLARVGLCLGVAALAAAAIILLFGGAFLNGYGKGKIERAFAAAHPGCALRIGKLEYLAGSNCVVAHSVILSAANTTLKIDRVSLTGVPWARYLLRKAPLADVLAKASLDATNLYAEFPRARYGLRCARLRASAPDSELVAEGTELRALVGDEDFFAARDFRTTRFHLVVPECRVVGLAYGELLQGKSYRAGSIHFFRPSFDALVNCDKPVELPVKPPLMAHEALAAIRRPVQVDTLTITNGRLTYCERAVAGGGSGVLTFGTVNMFVRGIANRADASAAIRIQAQGDLMDAGTLKVQMTIPITPPDFSLHYSGSLGAMDLTRLNAFLETAEHARIKTGSAQEAAFDIDVTAGQARGRVRAIYKDLGIALLEKQTDSEKGAANRVASFLINALKIRNSNASDASGAMREGEVKHTRGPDEEFLQFAWFALRSGVLDVITH
jgi:hypothetical protein